MKTPIFKSLLIKLQACNFIKKILQYRGFSVKFAKILRKLFYRTPQVVASAETQIDELCNKKTNADSQGTSKSNDVDTAQKE